MSKINIRNVKLALLFIGLIYLFNLNSYLSFGDDDAHYIILARALLSGRGYTDIQSPTLIPHTVYPPLFPFLLCPFILLFGENIFLLKFIPLFLMLGAIYILYCLLKDYDDKNNHLIILIFALNPLILGLATTLMSEAPYFLFSFLALFLLGKYSKENSKYLWLALLMMLMSFYTRSVGIVLLPAVLFYLVWNRDFKKAVFIFVLYLTGIFFWILRWILVGSGYIWQLSRNDLAQTGSGIVTLSGFILRFIHNFMIYTGKVLSDIFFYPHFYEVTKNHTLFVAKVTISIILFTLILYGYILRIKKKIKPVDLYVFFIFLTCFFWPVHGVRFISPIFPFLILYLFIGVAALAKKKRWIIYLTALMILLPGLFGDFQQIYKSRFDFYAPEERSYLDALEWIKQNTSLDSKIMCRKPRLTFIITGRRAMYYPAIDNPEKVKNMIEKNGINYVILDAIGEKDARFQLWITDRFLRPVIKKYPQAFKFTYASSKPETYVYRVLN